MDNISEEYNSLPNKTGGTFSFITYLNTNKNRYNNILTIEETRVRLKNLKNDYINANYIDFNDKKFISTQAPLPYTFRDFWKMVWDQESTFILMLSNFKENGKTKVDKYWLDTSVDHKFYTNETLDNSEINITIELIKEEETEIGILRTFILSYNKKLRNIYHFQYTKWSDHQEPSDSEHINKLIEYMEKYSTTVPIIHCSAGVGRSGTFIACNILKDYPDTNILRLVEHFRTQRVKMVQTEEQYKFLYSYSKIILLNKN